MFTAEEVKGTTVLGTSPSIPHCRKSARVARIPPASMSMPLTASPELDAIKRTQHYANKKVLFRQGERPGGVFILRRGSVKLSITSSKGRAVILRIARAGEMLDLSCALSGEPCMATAEALEDVEVAYVERQQFLDFLRHNPEAALSVAYQACANYKSACHQVSLLGLCRSARERLAQFLLNWAALKTYCETPVWLALTHEEISQIAGTTRETVTRTLMDFRKKGWASLAASNLVIQDRAAMEKLVA